MRAILCLPLFGLVACGGAGSESATKFATSPAQTFAAEVNGTTFTAKSAQTRQDLQDGGTTRLSSPVTYTFDLDAQTLTLVMDGRSHTIDISTGSADYIDEKGFTRLNSDGKAIFGTRVPTNSTFEAFLTGLSAYDYLMPLRTFAYSQDASSEIDRSYGVFGLETLASDLPNATASFSGGFLVDLYDVNSPRTDGRTAFFGDATLTVDFANNQVTSGSLDIVTRAEGYDPTTTQTGAFTIAPTPLSDNGFSAGLSANVTGLSVDPGGTINGTFFGNAAQEVGGSITFEGNLDGTDRVATGIFSAAQ